MFIDEPRLRQLNTVFLEENAKLNLSAFRTPEHCWVGNILDSLAVLQEREAHPELQHAQSIIDIGTGGGFPLLPLAIALPNAQCTGIDSIQKKVDAIQRIVDTMDIKNAHVLCGRAETLAFDATYRETFDIATMRAVAPLSVLLEYAAPFLRVGGLALCWKSTKIADELASSAHAQKILRIPYVGSFTYSLPEEGWGERSILFFKKAGPTSLDYPRRTGTPKKEPL